MYLRIQWYIIHMKIIYCLLRITVMLMDEGLDLETRRSGDTTLRSTSNSRLETLLSELFRFQAKAARPLDGELSDL